MKTSNTIAKDLVIGKYAIKSNILLHIHDMEISQSPLEYERIYNYKKLYASESCVL